MHTKRFEKYRRWIGIFLHNNIVQENACFYGNLEHPKDFLDYLSNRSWYSCHKAAGVISTFTHETLLINFDTLCTESCCQLLFGSKKVTFPHETLLSLHLWHSLPFRLLDPTFQTRAILRQKSQDCIFMAPALLYRTLLSTLLKCFCLYPSWILESMHLQNATLVAPLGGGGAAHSCAQWALLIDIGSVLIDIASSGSGAAASISDVTRSCGPQNRFTCNWIHALQILSDWVLNNLPFVQLDLCEKASCGDT